MSHVSVYKDTDQHWGGGGEGEGGKVMFLN